MTEVYQYHYCNKDQSYSFEKSSIKEIVTNKINSSVEYLKANSNYQSYRLTINKVSNYKNGIAKKIENELSLLNIKNVVVSFAGVGYSENVETIFINNELPMSSFNNFNMFLKVVITLNRKPIAYTLLLSTSLKNNTSNIVLIKDCDYLNKKPILEERYKKTFH